MTLLTLAAAWILAVVFVWAAVAKLRDLDAVETAVTEMGLVAASPISRLLAPTELAIAALLVTIPAVGAMAAFVLLVAFTAVLVQVLRSGRVVACACFGGTQQNQPVTWRALGRNLGLLALAAFATTSSGYPI